MEKVILIEGMSCQHCVAHVESALRQVAGVRKVKVDLGQKRAVVEVDGAVTDARLKAVVEEMGYDVTAIKENN
ncbi:MAG: heavy-metal-associated domain-containing protein [Firmicutes bacterium]|nr:heavy-metal-associated domain-containing protein [Bacillota bacterium]